MSYVFIVIKSSIYTTRCQPTKPTPHNTTTQHNTTQHILLLYWVCSYSYHIFTNLPILLPLFHISFHQEPPLSPDTDKVTWAAMIANAAKNVKHNLMVGNNVNLSNLI